MAGTLQSLPREAGRQVRIFKKSLPMQIKMHETLRSLGGTEGENCLDIGADSGMMSYHLRKHGGNWNTVATGESAAASIRQVMTENVHVLAGTALPFKEKSFDAVVILGHLEDIPADDAFIEECHRVLKTDGRLVLNVSHVKDWSLINFLRTILGLTPDKLGMVRSGYSESDLFRILKNGFDVHNVRSYSRFWLELTDVVVRFLIGRADARGDGEETKRLRISSLFSPLYWLAFQFDMLLFFTRGHQLIALAKRRAWRPRNAPVLVDGRSISEAVLTRPRD